MKNRKIYIFIRATGFYPLELASDAEAKATAELNFGTIRVETPDGKVIWQSGDAAMPNDQELSHAAGDCRQPETRSAN